MRYSGDAYSLPVRKSGGFIVGLGEQMNLALEDQYDAKGKSDVTKT